MPEHTVEQGECVGSVAYQRGFFWETIWNHASNSQLKQLRRDPNVLQPGDVLFIPERQEKQENGQTEMRHRFRRRGTPSRLRVRLLWDGQPRAHLAYVIDVDGQLLEGETDADGWLDHSIPPDARSGRLILHYGAEEYPFQLGSVDPVGSTSGVQQRLRNLGLYGGSTDGQMNDETRGAVAAFQARENLQATGEVDDATRDALRRAHCS